jgi:opacity protein-like surface antigen
LAIEAGVGYFLTDVSYSGADVDPVLGFINMQGEDEVSVIPIMITAKGVLPLDNFELYLGGGIGWYFADVESKVSISGVMMDVPFQGTLTFEGDDNVFGAHAVGGAIINITEVFFLGVEGKYVWTDEAKFEGNLVINVDGESVPIPTAIESDLTGYTVTGVIGFKF